MEALAARKRWRFHHIALAAAAIAFLAWCADAVDLRPKELGGALPVIGEYFYRMSPPKWEFSEVLWKPALETLYIALWGNVIALMIGLPLGVLAAANVTRSAVLRNGAKAPADPWGGTTLEWKIPSPPPMCNFTTPPSVPAYPYDFREVVAHPPAEPDGGPPRREKDT